MLGDGRYLGSPPALLGMWPRRLLRFIQEQARHQALSSDQTSHHAVVRAGRKLALVLRGRDISIGPDGTHSLVGYSVLSTVLWYHHVEWHRVVSREKSDTEWES